MMRGLDLEMAFKNGIKIEFSMLYLFHWLQNLFSRVSDIPSTFQYQFQDAPLDNAITAVGRARWCP